jgi:hypothetical protein
MMEVCTGRCQEDLNQFAGYLVFDALIANTDRHHQNWALLKRQAGSQTENRLAPSFDHASSLGREMVDNRRLLLLRQKRIPEYISKGWGAVYLETLGESKVSPMDLVIRLAPKMPELFEPWLKRIGNVTNDGVHSIVEQVPAGWMSTAQREFAVTLICQSRDQLAKVIS